MLHDPSKRTGTALAAAGLRAQPLVSFPAALAADNPSATDRALEASLPLSVRTSKREIWEDKTTTHGWDGELTKIEWATDLPEADRQKALQTAQQSLIPMTGAECQKALAKLRLMTKVRNESTEDIRLTLMFYEEELRSYPADVVRHVLGTQKNISPWWPAWSELKERLDLYSWKRRKLVDALKNGNAPKREAPAEKIIPLAEMAAPVGVEPETWERAKNIVMSRAKGKEPAPLDEPTPEEMERRRVELLAMCGEA